MTPAAGGIDVLQEVLTWGSGSSRRFLVAALDDLRSLGAPVQDSVLTAKFISALAMTGEQKARLLREFLRESGKGLTTEVLVAARDYSYHL